MFEMAEKKLLEIEADAKEHIFNCRMFDHT